MCPVATRIPQWCPIVMVRGFHRISPTLLFSATQNERSTGRFTPPAGASWISWGLILKLFFAAQAKPMQDACQPIPRPSMPLGSQVYSLTSQFQYRRRGARPLLVAQPSQRGLPLRCLPKPLKLVNQYRFDRSWCPGFASGFPRAWTLSRDHLPSDSSLPVRSSVPGALRAL